MRSARWLAGREGRTAITEASPAVMPANRDNKTMKTILTSALLAGVGLLAAGGASAADGNTLKAVKARGTLNCPGHNGSYLGFAELDDKGNWKLPRVDVLALTADGQVERIKGISQVRNPVAPTVPASRLALAQTTLRQLEAARDRLGLEAPERM